MAMTRFSKSCALAALPCTVCTIFTPSRAAAADESALPRDLTPWGMFVAADIVVQAVMVGLVLASVLCWTVWFAKSLEISAARRRLAHVRASLGDAVLFDALPRETGNAGDVAAELVTAGRAERDASAGLPLDGIKERVAARFLRIEQAAGRRIARGTGVLATTGAIAPFVGLFGTVWGIMNSFIGISKAQTTNLAVVAPGIAEALLATALGLLAAIPAVVMYNALARRTAAYRGEVGDIASAILVLIGRDLDRARGAPTRAAAE